MAILFRPKTIRLLNIENRMDESMFIIDDLNFLILEVQKNILIYK